MAGAGVGADVGADVGAGVEAEVGTGAGVGRERGEAKARRRGDALATDRVVNARGAGRDDGDEGAETEAFLMAAAVMARRSARVMRGLAGFDWVVAEAVGLAWTVVLLCGEAVAAVVRIVLARGDANAAVRVVRLRGEVVVGTAGRGFLAPLRRASMMAAARAAVVLRRPSCTLAAAAAIRSSRVDMVDFDGRGGFEGLRLNKRTGKRDRRILNFPNKRV